MWSRRGRGGKWRRRESNPLLLGASEAFFQKNLIPWGLPTFREGARVGTGGFPHAEATAFFQKNLIPG